MATPNQLWSVTALNLAVGQMGSTVLTSGSIATGTYGAVYCATTVKFLQLVDAFRDGSDITQITFPAGATLYGQFTTIQVPTGSVAIAYKKI